MGYRKEICKECEYFRQVQFGHSESQKGMCLRTGSPADPNATPARNFSTKEAPLRYVSRWMDGGGNCYIPAQLKTSRVTLK